MNLDTTTWLVRVHSEKGNQYGFAWGTGKAGTANTGKLLLLTSAEPANSLASSTTFGLRAIETITVEQDDVEFIPPGQWPEIFETISGATGSFTPDFYDRYDEALRHVCSELGWATTAENAVAALMYRTAAETKPPKGWIRMKFEPYNVDTTPPPQGGLVVNQKFAV